MSDQSPLLEHGEPFERHYESFPSSQTSVDTENNSLQQRTKINFFQISKRALYYVGALSKAWRSAIMVPDDRSALSCSSAGIDGLICHSMVCFWLLDAPMDAHFIQSPSMFVSSVSPEDLTKGCSKLMINIFLRQNQ